MPRIIESSTTRRERIGPVQRALLMAAGGVALLSAGCKAPNIEGVSQDGQLKGRSAATAEQLRTTFESAEEAAASRTPEDNVRVGFAPKESDFGGALYGDARNIPTELDTPSTYATEDGQGISPMAKNQLPSVERVIGDEKKAALDKADVPRDADVLEITAPDGGRSATLVFRDQDHNKSPEITVVDANDNQPTPVPGVSAHEPTVTAHQVGIAESAVGTVGGLESGILPQK